jgi:hypothetical protein
VWRKLSLAQEKLSPAPLGHLAIEPAVAGAEDVRLLASRSTSARRHNIGQSFPVCGLNGERERCPLEHKPARLKGKDSFRVAEYAVYALQEILRPPQAEQGLADSHRCPHLVPHVFLYHSFMTHNASIYRI